MIIRTNGNILEMLDADGEMIYSIQKGGPDAEEFIRVLADTMRQALQPRLFPVEEGGTYGYSGDDFEEVAEALSGMNITLVAGLTEVEED